MKDYLLYNLLNEEEENKGKDMKYGLPDQKKFPLYDSKHVSLAIKFFSYAKGKDRDKLARAIKARAKEYGMELSCGKDNPFAAYLPKESINESILDPIHRTRSPEVFNPDDTMKDDVRDFIIKTAQEWYENLDEKIFDIVGYKMIGSLSSFQYTEYSDCDLQLFVRMHDGHDFSETRSLVRILPNGNNIPDTLHPVNYFFVDEKDPTDLNKVESMYDLITKEWIKKADKKDLKLPIPYLREVARFFTDGFDLVMGRYDRDKLYLEDTFKLDPETQEISDTERTEAIERAKIQLQEDIDAMRLAEKLIHGFLLDAYEKHDYFRISIDYIFDEEQPRESLSNALYKIIDRFEYRKRLWDRISEGRSIIQKYNDALDQEAEKQTDENQEVNEEKMIRLFKALKEKK